MEESDAGDFLRFFWPMNLYWHWWNPQDRGGKGVLHVGQTMLERRSEFDNRNTPKPKLLLNLSFLTQLISRENNLPYQQTSDASGVFALVGQLSLKHFPSNVSPTSTVWQQEAWPHSPLDSIASFVSRGPTIDEMSTNSSISWPPAAVICFYRQEKWRRRRSRTIPFKSPCQSLSWPSSFSCQPQYMHTFYSSHQIITGLFIRLIVDHPCLPLPSRNQTRPPPQTSNGPIHGKFIPWSRSILTRPL